MRTASVLALCAFLVASYPSGAGEKVKPDDKVTKEDKFDAAKLVGQWKYVSGEKGGAKVAEKAFKDQVVTITKDTWTLKGEQTFVMKYEIDAKNHPVTIKLEMTESPFGAGAVSKGIIELKGDELRICYDADGKDAPTKFGTKDGDKTHLFVLRRAKGKEKAKEVEK